jgi:hypothetical protein
MRRIVIGAALLVGALGAGWLIRPDVGAGTGGSRAEGAAAAVTARGGPGAAVVARGAPQARGASAVQGGEVMPAVLTQAEANARSVVEAVQTGDHPERLNPLVPARPFDRAAFEADPQAYLDVVEPGRVWQTAGGAPGVKALRPAGVAYTELPPGGTAMLEVDGEPFAPVTFTSFDMGAFDNGLASITVRADQGGRARATFTAIAGTIDLVNILAGSPLAVGQAKLVVRVTEG